MANGAAEGDKKEKKKKVCGPAEPQAGQGRRAGYLALQERLCSLGFYVP